MSFIVLWKCNEAVWFEGETPILPSPKINQSQVMAGFTLSKKPNS
jgi:hypothetical protein